MYRKLLDLFFHFIADGIAKFFRVGFMPCLAFCVSVDVYGKIGQLYATVNLMIVLIGLNTPPLARHFYLKDPEQFTTFWNYVIRMSFRLLGIFSILFFAFGFGHLWTVLCLGYSLVIFNLFNFSLLAKSRKWNYAFWAFIINLTVYFIPLCVVYFASSQIKDSATFLIGFQAVLAILCSFIIILSMKIPIFTKMKVSSEISTITKKIVVPNFCTGITGFLIIYSDRYFISYYHGDIECGNYVYVYSLYLTLYTIISPFNNKVIPELYSVYNKLDLNTYNKKLIAHVKLSFTLFFCVPLFYVMCIIVKPNGIELDSITYFILGTSILFSLIYSFFQQHVVFHQKFGSISVYTFLAAILNLLLNYLLIPTYKGVGAAISTVASNIILYVLIYFKSRKLLVSTD